MMELTGQRKKGKMSDPKDTLYRQITLLQLIPRYPRKVSTPGLIRRLKERGFSVTPRSLQRDLKDRLSYYFPIICHDEEKPYCWSFDESAVFNLPSLDTPTALTLYLSEQQLRGMLPPAVANQLRPQFEAAKQYLDNLHHNSLGRWAKRVKALPNGKVLLAAPVEDLVWRCVAEALLENRCIFVSYLSRQKEALKKLTLHPAGIVIKSAITYLVARVEGYEDLRQFALHRIKAIETLETPADIHEHFEIDEYVKRGAFARQQGDKPVHLVADIHPQIAWLLKETPLSSKQKITPLNDSQSWFRLEAWVPDDQETLWWIYGLNSNIRVHKPVAWVNEISKAYKELAKWYAHAN